MTTTDDRSRVLHFQAGAIALVFVGGAVGAGLRGIASYSASPAYAVMAIFIANILGSFLLGYLLEWLARQGADEGWRRSLRLMLGTGFCGALTTYSTFAMDVLRLWGTPSHWETSAGSLATGFVTNTLLAVLYAVVSVLLGVAAAAFGIAVAAGLLTRPSAVEDVEKESSDRFVSDADSGFNPHASDSNDTESSDSDSIDSASDVVDKAEAKLKDKPRAEHKDKPKAEHKDKPKTQKSKGAEK